MSHDPGAAGALPRTDDVEGLTVADDFLGVLAVTSDLRHFACRPLPADGRA